MLAPAPRPWFILLALAGGCSVDADPDDGPMDALGETGDEAADANDPTPEPPAVFELGAPCLDLHVALECGQTGVRFCSWIGEEPQWGPCLQDPECIPGTSRIELCSDFDGTVEHEIPCQLHGGVPSWQDFSCPFTPLVLSWTDDMPELLAHDDAPGEFALAGGACAGADWPSATNPWLALDRDGDGRIEDGTELFGADTELSSGRRATHGFEALADLDHNGDGMLNAADPAFGTIVAWFDRNHDRRSTDGELQTLASMGIASLDLDYGADPICDARGNCAAETSTFTVWADASVRSGRIVDVYLACR